MQNTTSAKRSVAFVVTNYPPRMGGVETHVACLAAELHRRGHAVTVVCLGSGPGERDDDGVRVLTLRRRLDVAGVIAAPTLPEWRLATAELRRSGPSHVSVHTRFFPMTWLGLRLARRLGVPGILTEHGGGPVISSPHVTAAAAAVDRTMGRRALRSASRVLAVSARSAALVRRLAGRGSTVLGNGTDAAFWAAATPASRRHLLFAGRLVREKGWDTFLDVVAATPSEVTATVAGDGPDREATRRAVTARGLEGRVSLVGRLDREALRNAYAGSIYVNPSVAAEGFQTTLLEAGLAGARIATYDVGGAAEVVASGGAPGLIVPADRRLLVKAVLDLLASDAPGDPRILAAYDWPAVTDRFEDALGRTMEGR